MQLLVFFVFIFLLSLVPCHAGAATNPTPDMMGALGLNLAPSARMDEPGTVRATLAAIDPYLHATAGIQIAAPLYIGLRQTAEVSSLNGAADRLLPGADLRLRLWQESAHIPEITLGLQSAIGHKRMAGEYLALTKRFGDFDITGGIGWGRIGSAAHIRNPLKAVNSHFGKIRLRDGEEPNGPENWFTGEDAGFFAGIEYDIPQMEGLALKADWGGDSYAAEKSIAGYNAPAPWSVGMAYAPQPWINGGLALVGGEKLMARLTLQNPLQQWPGRAQQKTQSRPLRSFRTGLGLPAEMTLAADRENIRLYEPRIHDYTASAMLLLSPDASTPQQIGRAARRMADHAGEMVEELRITPLSCGLEGEEMTIERRDLEMALAQHQGSPQEIWRNISFNPRPEGKNILHDRFTPFDEDLLRVIWDSHISLAEEDSGLLYRTGLVLEEQRRLTEHFMVGGSLRLNAANNLHHLRDYRPRAILPVRSNIDDFAAQRFSVDRSFMSWMTTIRPGLHVALTGGMLEEMYGGAGGEILYRPFGKTFAIGAEAYEVLKRDPGIFANLGFNGDHLLTGHLQAWYEFPDSDLTLQARIGRYLAEDTGGTLALQKRFDNGATVEAFVTATNAADFDLFGGTTNLYSGLKFTLPVGNVPHLPAGSAIRLTAAPFGRDAGQALDPPVKLYETSEKLSYRHLTRHWTDIVE